jgi:hypothetical protein
VVDDVALDPLLGLELVSVRLETFDVYFVFSDSNIQIGTNFTIVDADSRQEIIDPKNRKGNLETAWKLVGSVLTDVIWHDHEVKFYFSNGSHIEVIRSQNHYVGTIVGAGMRFEDF